MRDASFGCSNNVVQFKTDDLFILHFNVRSLQKNIDNLITRGGVEDTRLEAKAKITKKFRGQGQTLSRPRPRTKDTGASVLQKKERFSKKFFRRSQKKVFKKFFQAKKVFKNFFSNNFHLRKTKKGLRKFSVRFLALSNKISTAQKIVLSLSQGQGNFLGLEALRPRPRTSKSVLEAKDVLNFSETLDIIAISETKFTYGHDLTKAFDTVNHDVLLDKMKNFYGF